MHGWRQGADRLAEAEGIEYELIIASKGEHVHEKVLHIQNVNAYGGRFKQWLNRSTASPPNICQATSAGGDGSKRARTS